VTANPNMMSEGYEDTVFGVHFEDLAPFVAIWYVIMPREPGHDVMSLIWNTVANH
jgi:hypothetical protein